MTPEEEIRLECLKLVVEKFHDQYGSGGFVTVADQFADFVINGAPQEKAVEKRQRRKRASEVKWTPERREEFKRLHDAGKNTREIADHFGASMSAIYRQRSILGLPALLPGGNALVSVRAAKAALAAKRAAA